MISSKYLPIISIILVSVTLVLLGFAMINSDKFVATGYAFDYPEKLFNTDEVLDINIIMDSEQWREMLDNAMSEEYYKCDVEIAGTTFYSVGIRPKGNTSLSSIANDPDNDRYSFKLEFDKFVDGQTCFGLDKLVLNNSYADYTYMKEALIYDMFQYLGADASLYNFAKINVNNEYFGVYLALEAVEESFMLRNYGTGQGYLYKPDSMNMGKRDENKNGGGMPEMPQNFQRPEGEFKMPENFNFEEMKKEMPDFGGGMGGGFPGGMGGGNGANLNYSNDNLDNYSAIWDGEVNNSTKADHTRVVTALKNISQNNNIEKYFDVDNILKYMAVHNFAVNDDSLSGGMAHNYYLYESNGQINILPWDYNLSLGGMGGGSNATSIINKGIDQPYSSTNLFECILNNQEYLNKYHEVYKKLTEYYTSGKFEETYNKIYSQIDSLVETDPNAMYTYEQFETGSKTLYDIFDLRFQSIIGQLEGTIPTTSEAQKDSSSLIDGSHINLKDTGSFMGGGRGR